MKHLISSAIILLLVSPFVNAHHNKGYYKAKVLDVTPVYEYVVVKYERDHCSSPHYSSYKSNHHTTVLGSVIGGSIGHVTSNRKHKVIGTVAGAIIGGVIAHKIDHEHDRYSSVRHNNCVIHTRAPNKQRRLRGYEVTYKMKGRIYQTFSQDRPNKYIRIYR